MLCHCVSLMLFKVSFYLCVKSGFISDSEFGPLWESVISPPFFPDLAANQSKRAAI